MQDLKSFHSRNFRGNCSKIDKNTTKKHENPHFFQCCQSPIYNRVRAADFQMPFLNGSCSNMLKITKVLHKMSFLELCQIFQSYFMSYCIIFNCIGATAFRKVAARFQVHPYVNTRQSVLEQNLHINIFKSDIRDQAFITTLFHRVCDPLIFLLDSTKAFKKNKQQ